MQEMIKKFLKMEAAGGIALMLAAMMGMAFANSPLTEYYEFYRQTLLIPVNDGFMAVFFWLLAMEIRREMAVGELASRQKVLLPLAGAMGGVVVPALIYAGFTHATEAARGWAIPSATDVAFSLGVLALFGRRVPNSLRIFLLALATFDDIAAILIIAVYYTAHIDWGPLAAAAAFIVILRKCAQEDVKQPLVYIIFGLLLWAAFHESGVHATMAGVVLGMMMPPAVSEKIIPMLHGWVAFGIIPLFALVNSGLPLAGVLDFTHLTHPIALGISLGLFLGKPAGIMAACIFMVWSKKAQLPEDVNWWQMLGISMIAGIGFTMSLFIGFLSFSAQEMQDYVRLGVIAGSLVSAMLGAVLLWICTRHEKKI